MSTKFYIFDQNNSGGYWNKILGYVVIIEAETPEKANEKAEEIGIYFDGVENDIDCECCGDRWCRVEDKYDEVEPEKLKDFVEEIKHYQKKWELTSNIYYADGRVEEII